MRDPHIDKLIQDLKAKKFREGEAKDLTKTYGEEITKQLTPLFSGLSKELRKEMADAFKGAVNTLSVDIPETKIPEIPAPVVNVPAPVVNVPAPIVNVPAPVVKIPETKLPEPLPFPTEFSLRGVDKLQPLPVMLMDGKGKPAQFGSGGATGGRGDFFTIKDLQTSAGASLIDQVDGALKVTGSFSLTTSPFATYYASDAVGSTNLVQYGGNTVAVGTEDGSGVMRFRHVSDVGLSVSVSDVFGSTGTNVINPDGRLKVELPTGSSGLTDTELRATAVPVSQVSGAAWSITVQDSLGSTITSHLDGTGDFRGLDIALIKNVTHQSVLNSSQTALGSGGTFTGLAEECKDYAYIGVTVFADVASGTDGLSIQQSNDGTNWDVTDTYTVPASTGKFYSFPVYGRYYRIVYTNSGSAQAAFRLYSYLKPIEAKPSSQRSSDAYTNETDLEQVWSFLSAFNGTTWDRLRNTAGEGNALRVQTANDAVASISVAGQTATLDVRQVSGASNSVTVVGPIGQGDEASALRVVHAGNASQSVNVLAGTITTVTTVTSITNSVAAVGNVASDVADNGDGPIKIGGIARTANPTAVAAGDRISATFDDLGRQVMRNVQVRDLIKTAYVSVTNGTETTLLAATAGSFNDLIMVVGSNNSDAAVSVDIRPVTAGNIINTLRIPANGTAGWTPPVPWPQTDTGNNWTVDGPDETGRTITISALFSTEI